MDGILFLNLFISFYIDVLLFRLTVLTIFVNIFQFIFRFNNVFEKEAREVREILSDWRHKECI